MRHRSIKPLLLLVLAGFCTPGTAQEYTPFYVQDARWTMEAIYPVIGPGDGHGYWEIYTLHDTLIDGKTYRLLATRNLCEKWPDGKGGYNYVQNLNTSEFVFGAIREEDRRVHFLRLNPMPSWKVLQRRLFNFPLDIEHLLYDFNAGQADTVRYSDLTFWTVTNGDTTFFTNSHFTILFESTQPEMGHATRRVANNTAYFFPHEQGHLIEGVGFSYGLFGAYDSFLTNLRCFEVDGQPLIFTGGCDPCMGMPTAVDAEVAHMVRLYPNPASDMLYVDAPGDMRVVGVTVSDLSGRVLLRQEPMAPFTPVDLSRLNRGMVLVSIALENGLVLVERIMLH